jgi:hypothetical protein
MLFFSLKNQNFKKALCILVDCNLLYPHIKKKFGGQKYTNKKQAL